jgi:hypothetical protein
VTTVRGARALWNEQQEAARPGANDRQPAPRELARRFQELMKMVEAPPPGNDPSRPAMTKGPKTPREAKNGNEGKAAAPPVLVVPLRVREYAHQHNGGGLDTHDTVLWHPALRTADGSVRVSFDLAGVPTTYRVLLLGHSPSGRLGAVTGRLEAMPAAK